MVGADPQVVLVGPNRLPIRRANSQDYSIWRRLWARRSLAQTTQNDGFVHVAEEVPFRPCLGPIRSTCVLGRLEG